MATPPQANMEWYYSKKDKEATEALIDRLAKAERRIQELEAKVQALELERLIRR
jgi:hypothetical protein